MNPSRFAAWVLIVATAFVGWLMTPRALTMSPPTACAHPSTTVRSRPLPASAAPPAYATSETLPLADNARLRLMLRDGLLHDREGLQRRLQAIPAGPGRWQTLNLAAEIALQEGLAPEAVSWLQQIPLEDRSPEIRDWAAEVWGATDLESAAHWVLSESDPSVRERLLGRLSIGVARSDPVGAIALAQQLVPPGETLNQTLAGIASRWAKTEPDAAADWAIRLPGAPLRESTLSLVLYPWFNREPEATQKWIAEQPTGPERDHLWSLLADWQIQNNPSLATSLIEHITPGSAQDTAALNLVRHWAYADFDQAGEWTLKLPATSLRNLLVTELEQVAQNLGQNQTPP